MRWQFWKRGETPQAETRTEPVRRWAFGKAKMETASAPVAPPAHDNPFAAYKKPAYIKLPNANMAMDAAPNYQALLSYGEPDSIFAEGMAFLGYSILALMAQRTEYRKPVEIIAKEMTRKWLRITAQGDDDKSEKVKAIEVEFERLRVQDRFREALEVDGFFGRAHIIPDFGIKDPEELQKPLTLTPAKVKKGSLKALRVVEPMWTYPGMYGTIDPISEDFYRPQSWIVMTNEVHASRVRTIITREVPDMMKPAYNFGGLPLAQMLKPYVDNWLSTRQSVNDIINAFTIWVLKTDLSTLTNPAPGDSDLLTRLQLFTQTGANRGVFALNKDSEEFSNISIPLGGLDKLQAQAQEHMAAAAGIPLVKLFGITPTGLGTTSEGEIQVFHEWLEAQQQALNPHVKYVLDIVQLNLFGEIDEGIGHAWEPMRHLDELQLATVRKTEADTDAVYVQEGILSPEEVRTRLAMDEDSPYAGIDVEDVPEAPESDDGGIGEPSNSKSDETLDESAEKQ